MPVSAAPAIPTQLLYDRRTAAKLLSISVRSVDRLIGNKQLTVRRVGRRILIPAGELKRFARADHEVIL
jgi:excisionase family DNA binding protein